MKHIHVKHGHATIDIRHDGEKPQDVFLEAESSSEGSDDKKNKVKAKLKKLWGYVKMLIGFLL